MKITLCERERNLFASVSFNLHLFIEIKHGIFYFSIFRTKELQLIKIHAFESPHPPLIPLKSGFGEILIASRKINNAIHKNTYSKKNHKMFKSHSHQKYTL